MFKSKLIPIIAVAIAITALVLFTMREPKVIVKQLPSSTVTTTAKEVVLPKTSTTICVQTDNVDDWPIQESMQSWNANGKNILSFTTRECDGSVIIQQAIIDKQAWAATTFFDSGIISIVLSPTVPVEHRQHVVCHELAHVFGLPHTQAQSCSNIDQTIPTPSDGEVRWIGSGLWQWRVSKANALHGGR